LIVTMDDADNTIYSAFFVAVEGTMPSFLGVQAVIVRVQEYPDRTLAIFHGPRGLARYDAKGKQLNTKRKAAAWMRWDCCANKTPDNSCAAKTGQNDLLSTVSDCAASTPLAQIWSPEWMKKSGWSRRMAS
jgi:hypothetical protein